MLLLGVFPEYVNLIVHTLYLVYTNFILFTKLLPLLLMRFTTTDFKNVSFKFLNQGSEFLMTLRLRRPLLYFRC